MIFGVLGGAVTTAELSSGMQQRAMLTAASRNGLAQAALIMSGILVSFEVRAPITFGSGSGSGLQSLVRAASVAQMEDAPQQKDDATEVDDLKCGPCSGKGSVQSNAGGEPHAVVCPWCEGTGKRIPEHDSQEAGERLREQPPASD